MSGFAIGGYILLYPFICAGLFAVLFVLEWLTRFFKDRGFRGWWGVPLAFFALLLVWIFHPVIHRVIVIDENDCPVSGAEITAYWSNPLALKSGLHQKTGCPVKRQNVFGSGIVAGY